MTKKTHFIFHFYDFISLILRPRNRKWVVASSNFFFCPCPLELSQFRLDALWTRFHSIFEKKKEFLIDFLKKWSRSSTLGRRVRGYSILINPFCSWIFYEYFDGNIVHVSFFLCWARNTNQQIDLFQLFFGKKQRNLNEKKIENCVFFSLLTFYCEKIDSDSL